MNASLPRTLEDDVSVADDPPRVTRSASPPPRSDRNPWNWLLVLPLLVTLYPPLYNRDDPELAGIPFFYWYQLAIISVGVLSTLVVYRRAVSRKTDRKGRR